MASEHELEATFGFDASRSQCPWTDGRLTHPSFFIALRGGRVGESWCSYE
jgi:uncharacterized Zn-finger protein